jgi:hypothetical protein
MTTTVEMITRDELTNVKLQEVYARAYMPAEIQPDGDVKLDLENLKVFAKVQVDKKILTLYSLFGVKEGKTRQQVLELCNRINDELVMLRASCPAALPQPALWLDHDLDIESGMTADDIVTETRRFRTVISAISTKDTEDILR